MSNMVQLVRTSSLKRAMMSVGKKMGMASKDESSDSESSSGSVDSETFISGLTDDIPEMRDDSVQLLVPAHRSHQNRDLPPRPKQLQKGKTHVTMQIKPQPKEAAASPPTVVTTKTHSSNSLTSSPASVEGSGAENSIVVTVRSATNVEFVSTNLSSLPHLLIEEILNENPNIVSDAIDRLARRCRKSEEIRDEAYRAGGHAIIVMAMRRWRDNELIQAGGCRCMTNMSCQYPDAKRSFAMIGGVESALMSMKTFPDSLQVQGFGCGALMNILCGHSEDKFDVSLKISERFVNQLDGISTVVEAMKRFPEDTKIQLGGCGLFQNLAQNKAFIYSMMQGGAVAAVGASLTSHPSDPSIKKAAGAFMKKVFE
jgi:hypothetical protein